MARSDCERLHSGWLAQPVNTASCAAFFAVGCWLLARGRTGDHLGVLVSGAVAVTAVGVGSIVYHGPQPDWADPVHSSSVIGLAFVLIAQTIHLIAGDPRTNVVPAWKAAGGWIAAGIVAYTLGRTGSSWCRPEALLQAHAGWHVLVAVGVGRIVAGYSKGPSK